MSEKTILIIDDAADVRKILKFHLEKKYKVLEARDGEEGFKILSKAHPDLVILDINMPKMDGIAFYNKLCSETGKPAVPVIVLTVREELGELFKTINVDGFITKPFNIEHVLREINTVIVKRYEAAPVSGVEIHTGPKKALIVENDPAAFDKIVLVFLNAGYMVSSAKSGMDSIEKIITDQPDIIVIKLGLPDISGDLICAKLKQMPKTMDIPVVLYTPHASTLDKIVAKKICEMIKTNLIESDDAGTLLAESNRVLKR